MLQIQNLNAAQRIRDKKNDPHGLQITETGSGMSSCDVWTVIISGIPKLFEY